MLERLGDCGFVVDWLRGAAAEIVDEEQLMGMSDCGELSQRGRFGEPLDAKI